MSRLNLDDEIKERKNLEVKHTHRHLEIVQTWIEKNCRESPVDIEIPSAESSRKISQPIADAAKLEREHRIAVGTEEMIKCCLAEIVRKIKEERKKGSNWAYASSAGYSIHCDAQKVIQEVSRKLRNAGYFNVTVSYDRYITMSVGW